MLQLIEDLSKLRLAPVSPDMKRCREILQEELPFRACAFPSGTEKNGWIVPQSWHVERATIHNAAGELVYDGMAHALGVCMYSDSFVAGIGGEELKKHLYFSDKYDDALIYHCDWLYKPHQKSWGFSVPKKLYDAIGDGDAYHVELRTVHAPGTMESLVFTCGDPDGSHYILNAHNCHPSLCNDDLSGIAVGVEAMRRIQNLDPQNLYSLVIAPEHYGTVFLADQFSSAKAGLFLEAFGTGGKFAHQLSYRSRGMDAAIENALIGKRSYSAPFRQIAGNDESVWEAVGVPCSSLTRYPFPEYHTSNDNVSLMDVDKLNDAVKTITDIFCILEDNCRPKRLHERGLVCLSNPKYDLYQPYFDPSIPDRREITPDMKNWNQLMNDLPQMIEDRESSLAIANRYKIPHARVREYLQRFEELGLIATEPAAWPLI